MNKFKLILLIFSFLGILGFSSSDFSSVYTWLYNPQAVKMPINSAGWIDAEAKAIYLQAANIDANVLKLSLSAYVKARKKGLGNKQLLTIIDYSKPSTDRRLWVIDIRSGRVLFNTWVTHGKNSGHLLATSFSNEPGSLKSSLGVFLTQTPYIGENGYSLRLMGLEEGVNDNAFKRDIVVHGAWYANPEVIKKYGEMGRSWGCPAVSPATVQPLINTIKNNTLMVVYYPDKKWLTHSTFVTG